MPLLQVLWPACCAQWLLSEGRMREQPSPGALHRHTAAPSSRAPHLAHAGGDGEAGGHVQAQARHLTEVGTLAAQLQGREGAREGAAGWGQGSTASDRSGTLTLGCDVAACSGCGLGHSTGAQADPPASRAFLNCHALQCKVCRGHAAEAGRRKAGAGRRARQPRANCRPTRSPAPSSPCGPRCCPS